MSEDLKRQIEDLVAQLRQKDAELGTLRDQANKVVSQKLQDAQTQIETLTKALDQKTAELNDTAEKLKKAEEKLKQFEDQQKTSLISELTDAKIGTEEELGKRSLHELQVMRETLAKAQILKEKTHVMDRGFPKPDQEQRKKPAPPQKQTLGAVVIDLNELKEKA